MRPITACACALVLLFAAATGSVRAQSDPAAPANDAQPPDSFPGGELRVVTGQGGGRQFPLKHTEVHAEITGSVAQVRVSQIFQNPYDRPIEAVYVFPLPRGAAVDDLEIRFGDRIIRGVIRKREEARALYDQARRSGRAAALLDQERPNLFTQSVANILPGEEIVVSLRYFDLLPYESGSYEFAFPMVVGPRFIPGQPVGQAGSGRASDTTDVPDASRINPAILKPGVRSGHDISLEVQLHAGVPLQSLASPSHAVDIERPGPDQAQIRLRQEDSIPNKDFVLRYRIDGTAPGLVLLPHRTEKQGHFLMLIQPEVHPSKARIAPKEMIFVVDCSGSMSGFPIEKVKEAMHYALENLNPLDNFQIIRFANEAESFAPEPVPATPSYIARAQEYVEGLSGAGGTIMLEGVKTALSTPEDPQRLRIISFMTDGYIGNEDQILAYLRKNLGGARLFSFGVGSSPNRYLLDKMAEFGHGAVQYLLLNDRAAEPIRDFYERIRSPYLTDLVVDWEKIHVSEIYPPEIPDLFLGQPVVLFGAYEQAGAGEITLRGRLGGQPYEQRLGIELPERSVVGEAISSLWARSKIEDLSNQQIANPQPSIIEAITDLALAHRLVSAYTSLVAVDDRQRSAPVEPPLVEVPVPAPDGMNVEGGIGVIAAGVIGSAAGGIAQPSPAEMIRVAAQAPIVNSEGTQLSTTITSEFLSEIPVLGCDYQDVLALAPGVTAPGSASTPNVHGARNTDVLSHRHSGLPAFSRLRALRNTYHLGEEIEVFIAIKNLSRKTILVPASLSVPDGTALFRILDDTWTALPHPASGICRERKRKLPPGGKIAVKVTLNGAGGYRLDRPGLYHIVFLGSELGLPDSTQLTLRVEP